MKDWTPLTRATLKKELPGDVKEFIGANEIWMNSDYTVFVRRGHQSTPDHPKITWLSIKRNDKHPCRDWRHFQWIKNQLCGPECEGVELFPKESRLVDGSNQYHLWVLEDSSLSFPFGFDDRQISETPLENGRQRPFPINMKPVDLEAMELKAKRLIADFNSAHGTQLK